MTPRSRLSLERLRTVVAPWLVGCGILCATSVASGPSAALPETVPAFVAEAAQTSVADLAYALAEASIPAGFVVFEGDFDDQSIGQSGVLWHLRSEKETRTVPLETVVAAFRARHPGYEVEDRSGALLIRANSIGFVPLLDEARGNRFQLNGEPLGTAFNKTERLVDPTIPVRGGVVGSVASNPDEPARSWTEPTVSLDIQNATLVSALNEIVKGAPGTVWVLSRHRNGSEYYTLAYRMPGGLLARLDDQLRIQRKR